MGGVGVAKQGRGSSKGRGDADNCWPSELKPVLSAKGNGFGRWPSDGSYNPAHPLPHQLSTTWNSSFVERRLRVPPCPTPIQGNRLTRLPLPAQRGAMDAMT